MGNNPAVEVALLEWINDFAIAPPVTSTTSLIDGLLLWKTLQHIDPKYFNRDLPSPEIKDPDYWLPKWQNLKQVDKEVRNYIRDEAVQELSLAEDQVPNTKTIAVGKEDSTLELVKLLKVILLAAVYSPNAQRFIEKMQNLSLDAQGAIKVVIEEMASSTADSSPITTPAELSVDDQENKKAAVDPELLFEERLGKALAETETLAKDKKELQRAVTELHGRLSRVQENNQALQERLTAAEDKLSVNGSASKGFDTDPRSIIQRLEKRIQEQEDFIAHYESNLANLQLERDQQEKTIESLNSSSGGVQRLRDELVEVRMERDNLAKKANVLDRYKQKLQATQHLEEENRELRNELEEHQQQMKRLEESVQQSRGLNMAIEQYRRTIERIEQDFSELQTVKRRLELDNTAFNERWETMTAQQARDSELISDLQEKIAELEAGTGPRTDDDGSLAAELDGSDKTRADLRIEISKLKAEMHKMRNADDSGAQRVMLESLLEDAKKKAETYEQKYLDIKQQNLSVEKELSLVSEGRATEGNEVFIRLRESLVRAENELSKLKEDHSKITAEYSIAKRELVVAKSDLSMVGKDKLDVLDELKKTNFPEREELRKESEDLHRRLKEATTELDQQKSLLNTTLLQSSEEKDRFHQNQLAHNELKATVDVLKAGQDGGQDAQVKLVHQLTERLEQAREKLAKRTEHIKKQNSTISELEERLRQVENSGQQNSAKAKEEMSARQENELQQEAANVKREMALITTAWYDLNIRLQQESVFKRRGEPPRGWLNRQRENLNNPTKR